MTTAHMKVDWLRFSVPTASPFGGGSDFSFEGVLKLLDLALGEIAAPIFGIGDWQLQRGRGVYQHSRMNTQNKVVVSWGDVNACIDVDCSGQACEEMRSAGAFYDLLQEENMRVSRIDLASDFETDLDVSSIIAKGYNASYKTTKVERSPKGDTTNIGARKSERMLRVYRYHPPHPRSKFLRFEVEIKGRTARTIAPRITVETLVEVCASALAVFGLKHTLVSSAVGEVSALPTHPYDKANSGRMRWLMTQVLPALVKAHQQGDINAREWCETHLFSALE